MAKCSCCDKQCPRLIGTLCHRCDEEYTALMNEDGNLDRMFMASVVLTLLISVFVLLM
jgi:hypothetical protein